MEGQQFLCPIYLRALSTIDSYGGKLAKYHDQIAEIKATYVANKKSIDKGRRVSCYMLHAHSASMLSSVCACDVLFEAAPGIEEGNL